MVKNGFGHLRPFEYEYRFTEYEYEYEYRFTEYEYEYEYRFTEYEDEYEYRFTDYEYEEIRPEARTIIDTWYLILAY